MTSPHTKQFQKVASMPSTGAWKRRKRTRDCPRVTVRLSPEDPAKLIELADGMALSAYLRAKALSDDSPRRRRSGSPVKDRVTIACVLGMLGQSRIANNLNQLAYHANIFAQGSRRAFVAMDEAGKTYSLSRWTGAGAKALRDRMGLAEYGKYLLNFRPLRPNIRDRFCVKFVPEPWTLVNC